MLKKITKLSICMLMILSSLGVASALSTTENKISILDTEIAILKPYAGVYIFNMKVAPLPAQGEFRAIVIGMVDVQVDIINPAINTVKFYVDGKLKETITQEPYTWTWNERMVVPPKHTLKVVGYDGDTEIGNEEIGVLYINPFSGW